MKRQSESDGYKNHVEVSADNMIKYLRHVQKKYILGDEEISGVEILNQILSNGDIKMSNYIKVREAIEKFDQPYEITLI